MFTIKAKNRNTEDSLAFIRKQGDIPAVFYGAGKKTTSISVPNKEFTKIWKGAGESSTITIETENGKIDALIHDIAVDPLTGAPLHADFLVVDMNKTIQVSVALEFSGLAPVVKNATGTVVKVMHEIEIEALPKDLPHVITVDVTSLENIDSQITVADLKLPAGVTAVSLETEVVAAVALMKEEVEEVAAPIDLASIEVEKKGKKEEEVTDTETGA